MYKQICGIFITMLTVVQFAYTQDNSALYNLSQYAGTQDSIKYFLKNLNIDYKTDTVYLFILSPMQCPRCEGLINPIATYLKKIDSSKDILLLAFYSSEEAVLQYLYRKNFKVDTSIYCAQNVLKYFNFSPQPLTTPFILKFNITTGDLITSRSLLGFHADSLHVMDIVKANNPMEKSEYRNQNVISNHTNVFLSAHSDTLYAKGKIELKQHNTYSLSRISYLSTHPDKPYISFVDKLTGWIFIYNITTGSLVNIIEPTIQEERKYIDKNCPEQVYEQLKQNNIIHSIYLSNEFIDDTTLAISASLPKLEYKNDSDKVDVKYSNETVIVYKNFLTNQVINVNKLNEIENYLPEFVNIHKRARFYKDKLYIPIEKGWPVKGTAIVDVSDTNVSINPFLDKFYDTSPLFSVYNNRGEFLDEAGQLPTIYKRLKLGYFSVSPFIDIHNSNVFIADGSSGVVHQYDNIDEIAPSDSFMLFSINKNYTSAIDYHAHPLKYMTDVNKNIFNKEVIDFRITDDNMFVLFKEAGITYVLILKINSKEVIKQYFIPENKDAILATVILAKHKGSVTINAIYKSAEKFYYTVF